MKEAHRRGGKLLAVEYVDPSQGGDVSLRKSQVEVEKAAFDGFAVTWNPTTTIDVPDCSILVRFNFLSTDFSRSKGVNSIPVRLCAKTELVSPQDSSTNEPEVCFSKVKLFRNHGAERKVSIDAAQIKKIIEKLKRQIVQAEQDLGDSKKRKRSQSTSKLASSNPGQVVEHQQPWPVDSDVEFGRSPTVDDLYMKLSTMQGMFSSTHPVSTICSRGEAQDDPDVHSIILLGGETLEGVSSKSSTIWGSRPSISSSLAFEAGMPIDSSISQRTSKRKSSEMLEATILHGGEDDDGFFEADIVTGARLSPRSVKVPKLEGSTKEQSEILALGVDDSYEAPVEKPVRPGKSFEFSQHSPIKNPAAACFYLRQNGGVNEYYTAVYLFQRTVQDLIDKISRKFQKDPARVTHVIHVNSEGLYIGSDEDVVREVPEGQDMLVEFLPTHRGRAVKHEQTPFPEFMDGIIDPINMKIPGPLEMWLIY